MFGSVTGTNNTRTIFTWNSISFKIKNLTLTAFFLNRWNLVYFIFLIFCFVKWYITSCCLNVVFFIHIIVILTTFDGNLQHHQRLRNKQISPNVWLSSAPSFYLHHYQSSPCTKITNHQLHYHDWNDKSQSLCIIVLSQ